MSPLQEEEGEEMTLPQEGVGEAEEATPLGTTGTMGILTGTRPPVARCPEKEQGDALLAPLE